MIAPELKPDHELVIAVSGGKDSTAMALWFEFESEIKNKRHYVMMDTGHEHAWTYEHIDILSQKIKQPIHRAVAELSFIELAVKKKRFPSLRGRFCTENLKVKPLKKWIEENTENPVVVMGIRAEESRMRAALPAWQDGHFERFRNYYDCPIWRPIMGWDWEAVFAIHDKYDFPPNPLYLRGAKRVGCFPCIHSGKADLRACFEIDPDLLARLVDYEARVNEVSAKSCASFFALNKTPRHFHDRSMVTKDGRTITYASIEAVYRWAVDPAPDQGRLFDEDVTSCMSQYGLCE